MESENRREQHYAVSKGGVLSHITDAYKSKDEFFCPYCKCRMLKKCGPVRTWHFAHDYRDIADSERKCSYESYLHAYAKLRIKQWFDESDEINIHYKQQVACPRRQNCIWVNEMDDCILYEDRSYNVKRILTECTIEESVRINESTFRADLLWKNPDRLSEDSILIEIKVTHGCTRKKKDSTARIIEFEVRSEEDVDRIIKNDIIESSSTHFYGFKYKMQNRSIDPKFQLVKYILYKNGAVYSKSNVSCQNYLERKPSSIIEMTAVLDEKGDSILNNVRFKGIQFGKFYNWGMAIADKLKCNSRSCYLCKHHSYDYDKGCLSCFLTLSDIEKAKQALQCPSYDLSNDICKQSIAELKEYAMDNIIDIWHSGRGAISIDMLVDDNLCDCKDNENQSPH